MAGRTVAAATVGTLTILAVVLDLGDILLYLGYALAFVIIPG